MFWYHNPILCLLDFACRKLWECGIACAATSSLIFAFSALFVKLTHGRIPVLEVCVIRSSFCFILSAAAMTATKTTPILGAQKHRPILFWRGCCGAMAMISYYVALFLLPLGDAIVIGMIGPPITAVTAKVFLREPLG
jgi:drug/metabolite transporter (DMT)-like permease